MIMTNEENGDSKDDDNKVLEAAKMQLIQRLTGATQKAPSSNGPGQIRDGSGSGGETNKRRLNFGVDRILGGGGGGDKGQDEKNKSTSSGNKIFISPFIS